MRPSLVRSKTAPHASSSRTRSGASFACSSAMRKLLRYCPPRIVSEKWTFQLSRSSTLADVEVGGPDGEHRDPRPEHVVFVEPRDAPPRLVLHRAASLAREAVGAAADEVAQRVAAERERREEDDVRDHHERADADPEA